MFRFGGVASRGPRVHATVYCYCGNTPSVESPSVNRDAIHLAAFRDAYPDLPLAELVIKSVSKRGPPQPPQTRKKCNVAIESGCGRVRRRPRAVRNGPAGKQLPVYHRRRETTVFISNTPACKKRKTTKEVWSWKKKKVPGAPHTDDFFSIWGPPQWSGALGGRAPSRKEEKSLPFNRD